ncbi:MAG: hypothetical protein HY747_11345 [Elusimicrobia bacterium]|nr:hypothetical protein [Elusimicrobiota bacterium]
MSTLPILFNSPASTVSGHAFNDRLFDQTDNETSGLERLRQFCLCKDGFEIGELDLKKRGPGDLIGFDQHGLAQFKHFDWNKDIRLIASAKALSKDVCDGDFRLEKNHFLKQAIAERFGGDFLQSDIS